MIDLLSYGSVTLVAVSFGIGIVIGLTGMGGGALMTPALIFLGLPPSAAVSNDLVAAAVNKTVGATVHWRAGSPNLQLAGWLILGSVPTAFAGAFILRALGDGELPEELLKIAIGATLLLAATTYSLRRLISLRQRPTTPSPTLQIRPVPTVAVGAVGGLLVGLTSVGSGSLIMVALLMLYPRLSSVRIVGTDLVQAIPIVVAASISHVVVTGVDWAVLIPLLVGGPIGTYLGARLAGWVHPRVVRRGIVLVLSLTGLTLLRVPPIVVSLIGGGLLILGPLGWTLLRSLTEHGRRDLLREAGQVTGLLREDDSDAGAPGEDRPGTRMPDDEGQPPDS